MVCNEVAGEKSKLGRRRRRVEQEQTTIRLTLRLSETLNNIIRDEAVRRGMNINQMILGILNKQIRILETQ